MQLMNLKRILYENILYSIHWLGQGPTYGVKTIKVLKHLNQSQWWSSERIREYQNGKLRMLIEHVYHNVPYYHHVMKSRGIQPQDIRNKDDLKYLPILTKEIIRANFQDIIFQGMNKRTTTKRSTSGTTGERLTFFQDRNSRIWVHASKLRGWSWAGYNIGDSSINIYNLGKLSTWGQIASRMIREYYFPTIENKNQVLDYSNKIKVLKPRFLSGFTSSLCLNASLFKIYNITGIHFPVIFTCAEMLYDYQRSFLEETFHGTVYDYYGSNEIGSLAYECEHHNKHITEEHVVFETTNSQGANVSNISGDIILTDLDNYGMPFIRYKIGDVGTLSDNECKCGRALRILNSLDGRSQEFLKTLDGRYVPGIYFPGRFRKLKGIEQFQIIQPDIHNIILKIVKNNLYSPEELDTMIRMIKDKIGNDINIKVEQCDNIPLTSGGKTRLVVSHLPTEF